MVSQSNIINNGVQIGLRTGSLAVAAGDLLEIGGPGNEASSVNTIDYAAHAAAGVINGAAGTTGKNFNVAGNYTRTPIARDPQGNIFVLTSAGAGASTGIGVGKFVPGGTVTGGGAPTALDNTADQMLSPYLLTLDDNVFAAVYMDASSFAVKFVVFDAQLSTVKAPTTVGVARNTVQGLHSAIALSGGGFAVAYQDANQHMVLATFDDAGAPVLAPTTIATLGGVAADAFLILKQLSNGNLALVWHTENGTSTPLGTEFVIVTAAGVNVAGPTNIGGQVSGTFPSPMIDASVLSGFFAVSIVQPADLTTVVVMANDGTVEGTVTGCQGPTLGAFHGDRLLNDGASFWYLATSGGTVGVTQIKTSGVKGAANNVSVGSGFVAASAFDAAMTNNVIICVSGPGGGAAATLFYAVVGLPDPAVATGLPFTAVSGTAITGVGGGSKFPAIIAADFTGVFACDDNGATENIVAVIKTFASAIVGVSLSTVAGGNTGSRITVNEGPGAQPCNPLIGTSGTAFDHTSAGPPAGNKGKMFSDGVSLTGL